VAQVIYLINLQLYKGAYHMVSVFWGDTVPSYNSCYAEEDTHTQTLQNLGLYKMEEKLEGLVHGQEEEEEEL
jgi:hypothetical protein